MLKLTEDQLSEMDRVALEDSLERFARFIKNNYGPFVSSLSNEAIAIQVSQGHLKAKEYGVRSVKGILQFISLTFIAGPSFDMIPQVQKYLKIDAIDPDAKIQLLLIAFERRLQSAKQT